MSKILNFTSDDFLEMAIRCKHNSIVLKDSFFSAGKPKNLPWFFFLVASTNQFCSL
ncbi:MAG: hypothetical protein IIC67_12495 [Thaumarchaeota archaeon]|nr:hypothetical protein [Nitrososphaerota archaeon]